MKIEIRKLVPEDAEDYVTFFDTTPHYENEIDYKCYCVNWCSDRVKGNPWPASPDERRIQAIKRVQEGNIQGYLAYHGDKIVGWCNAITKKDVKANLEWLRNSSGVPAEYLEGENGKFIFCFAIAPRMQRLGIATQLLQYVCQDATAEGYDFVEGFSNKDFTDKASEFRGPLAMYEKCGFNIHAEYDGKLVVRKLLK